MAVIHITTELEAVIEQIRIEKGYKHPYQVIEDLLRATGYKEPKE
jgi:hypothetical protein